MLNLKIETAENGWVEPCPECDGAGFITWLEEPYDSIDEAIRSKRCEACGGSGEMQFPLTTKE